MLHRPTLITEIRELPPQDGWACHEATGRATVVCPCGLNTGWIPKADATSNAQTHTSRGT